MATTHPVPWTTTPPGVELNAKWLVHDDNGFRVCVCDDEFTANTIVRAASVLSEAIHVVDNEGACIFCNFDASACGGDVHEADCPMFEVP